MSLTAYRPFTLYRARLLLAASPQAVTSDTPAHPRGLGNGWVPSLLALGLRSPRVPSPPRLCRSTWETQALARASNPAVTSHASTLGCGPMPGMRQKRRHGYTMQPLASQSWPIKFLINGRQPEGRGENRPTMAYETRHSSARREGILREAGLWLRLHHTKDGDVLLSPHGAEALGVVHDKGVESPGAAQLHR